MLKASIREGTLHIEDTEPRLCSLTIYHGCPHISIHYITDIDKEALANLLVINASQFEEAACEYCRDMGWTEPS